MFGVMLDRRLGLAMLSMAFGMMFRMTFLIDSP